MIGYVMVAGSGLEIKDDVVVGLSEASFLRAETAVGVYEGGVALDTDLSSDVEFHFAGAYPRLPKGMVEIELVEREAFLMREHAVLEGLPRNITQIEPNSTSTVENVVHTVRQITNVHMPDDRDIARFINPDHKLAFIASSIQMRRLSDAFIKMGGSTNALEFIPTSEEARAIDRVSLIAHRAGMLFVPTGNIRALDRVDGVLEVVNDNVHYGKDALHRTAAAAAKKLHAAKRLLHAN